MHVIIPYMTYDSLLSQLAASGHRLTALRKAMLRVFRDIEAPFAYRDINTHIQEMGVFPNKTSIYRELDFFLEQNIIKTVRVDSKAILYELAGDHHHHAMCNGCKTVMHVPVNSFEAILKEMDEQLARRYNFKYLAHDLAFFGICNTCSSDE